MDRHPRVEAAIRNIEDLAALLTSYPGKLFDKRTEAGEASRKLDGVRARIKDRELEVAALVAGEPSGIGLKYTNDTARKAEVASRLKKDPDYQALVEQESAATAALEIVRFRLQEVEDERRAVEKIADLRENQARLDVADMDRHTAQLREAAAKLERHNV